MKKIYCNNCEKYAKLKNLKNSYIWNKAFVLSTSCAKSISNNNKIFKEKEFTEVLKSFGLIDNVNE